MKWPWSRRPAPPEPSKPEDPPWKMTLEQAAQIGAAAPGVENPFAPARPRPGVVPDGKGMAMDWNPTQTGAYAGDVFGMINEGLGFIGYPYLAQMAQRPEYRSIVEITAKEMTRKGFKITATGDDKTDKIERMEQLVKLFSVNALLRQLVTVDGFFGRSQLYIDTGIDGDDLALPLVYKSAKIKKGGPLAFRVIEPFWTYPGAYDATNPLAADFYVPQVWYCQSLTVHRSRLLTFIARPVPDILKPAYAFGGLALTQMAKPYVDNWLRARQSVSDIMHSFSIPVLLTNMATVVQGAIGGISSLLARLQIFNRTRDNRGVMAIDKDTEDFKIAAAPLGSLDKLQAQAQEQTASVVGIPLVILLGVTPSGLNASSDGEVRTFYAKIKANQEQFFRENLTIILQLLQLWEWGAIDETIDFVFNDLWETSELDASTVRKNVADTDVVYVNAGVIAPEEIRDRLAGDDESIYNGLSGPPPEPPAQAVAGEEDDEPKETAGGPEDA